MANGVYIRVKLEVNITRVKSVRADRRRRADCPALNPDSSLTPAAATHINCRNEMMPRTALCAILLLRSW
jgi:hypothetical protein